MRHWQLNKSRTLVIDDIKEWLAENRQEYQNLKSQLFPPIDNQLYWLYSQMHRLIEYSHFISSCEEALLRLSLFIENKSPDLKSWVIKYELLGANDLLMFNIDYLDWKENVSSEVIKIQENIYVERRPFECVIRFLQVFQLLYWDYEIHHNETTLNLDKILQEVEGLLKS